MLTASIESDIEAEVAQTRECDADSGEPRFEDYVVPLYTELLNHARRLCGGRRERAEDIVQDSMIRAQRAWSTFVDRGGIAFEKAVRSWCFRIVNNVFITAYQLDRKRREVSNEECGQGPKHPLGEAWDAEVEDPRDEQDSSTGDEVREAVASLAPHHRVVVEMHYLDGKSLDKVAAELGVPKNTVFTRLHRARLALHKRLAKYAERAYGIDAGVVKIR